MTPTSMWAVIKLAGTVTQIKAQKDLEQQALVTFGPCKFSWQKKHVENLTGTEKAYKPEGSLSSITKKNMKKYETWKF